MIAGFARVASEDSDPESVQGPLGVDSVLQKSSQTTVLGKVRICM